MNRIGVAILPILVIVIIGAGICMGVNKKATVIVAVGNEKIINHTFRIAEDQPIPSKALFDFAFSQPSNIKYLKPGHQVTISFPNNSPDKISMTASVLNSKGEFMYTGRETIDVPLSKTQNKWDFIVKKHIASMYSSNYEENKKDFIGYVVRMSWGKISYVSVFVIKTDAS